MSRQPLSRSLRVALAASLLVALPALAGEEPLAGEVPLENELPVSGPRVLVRFPYGSGYHPGAAVVLAGRIQWPAGEEASFDGGVTVQEGEGPAAPRYGQRLEPGQAGAFRFPIRAPAGGATLTLSLWQQVHGHPQDRFRASLVKVLKVLPRGARVVLKCGATPLLPARPDLAAAAVSGAEMPGAEWMYENVDLVVLGRGAFTGLALDARDALRRWVLGGGRLLIAAVDAASREVLLEAVQSGLTALPRDTKEIRSSSDDLLRLTGLKEENLRRDARGQVVFVQHALGLGGVVFFLPSANPEAVWQEMRVLAEPVLAPERPLRADARVWSRPYDYFAPGVLPAARRQKMALYAVVGAVCLIVALFFASGERRRYMAAGWALGVVALLSALLTRGFPVPEMAASVVELTEVAADGRAARRTEWTLLEGLRDFSRLNVSGPEDGTLTAVHFREDELPGAAMELEERGGLRCGFRAVSPPPPAPLFQALRVVEPPAPGREEAAWQEHSQCFWARFPPGGWRVRLLEGLGRWPAWGVLARRDGSKVLLLGPWDEPQYGGFHEASFRGEADLISRVCAGLSETEARARAKALSDALDGAAARGRDLLVFWGDSSRQSAAGLVRTEGVAVEQGARFAVWAFQVQVKDRE
jgi:hypothetical protein